MNKELETYTVDPASAIVYRPGTNVYALGKGRHEGELMIYVSSEFPSGVVPDDVGRGVGIKAEESNTTGYAIYDHNNSGWWRRVKATRIGDIDLNRHRRNICTTIKFRREKMIFGADVKDRRTTNV